MHKKKLQKWKWSIHVTLDTSIHNMDKNVGKQGKSTNALFRAGVLMTGVLGVLAGCRARAARRRRRGKPLAHDADYLVNGMYL